MFANDETAYAQVMRITPIGALAHLEAAVARSPDFRLWYGNSEAQIYELVVRNGLQRELRRSKKIGGPSRDKGSKGTKKSKQWEGKPSPRGRRRWEAIGG